MDIINRTTGSTGLRVMRNIPFGRHVRQKLDIYAPAPRARTLSLHGVAAPVPVIILFYGGSWQHGRRQDYRFAAVALARLGNMVVVPDYRVYPDVKFPGFLQDCADATAWVFKNIQNHGGNEDAVFLLGHSAGAYNAAMLALDPTWLNGTETDPARLAGWVGLAGPYDFLPFHDAEIARIFSEPADARVTQPIHHVRPGAPPALLLHGGRDRTVLPHNTAILAARLRENANAVETRIYPRLGHTGVLAACLPYLKWRAPVLRHIAQFTASALAGEFADAGLDISAPMLR